MINIVYIECHPNLCAKKKMQFCTKKNKINNNYTSIYLIFYHGKSTTIFGYQHSKN